jgi:hypothetical protein
MTALTPEPATPTTDLVEVDRGTLATLVHEHEALTEAVGDYARAASGVADILRRDDQGWSRLGGDAEEAIDRERLLEKVALARVMAVADPLIKRGLVQRQCFVWGRGVTIRASKGDTSGAQDVNAVVQGFLDDPSNRATFASSTAHAERERTFGTDGNLVLSLITDPVTGRVQVRHLPLGEIVDVITNPEDAAEVWLYKREYTARVIEPGTLPSTTRTRRESRRVLYPALGFTPSVRAKTLDGMPVEWDKPVVHVAVNAIGRWGVPDAYAALPWAQGYRDVLSDLAKYIRAVARLAFTMTTKSARTAAAARERFGVGPDGSPTAPGSGAGQTAIMPDGTKLAALGPSSIRLDADSGKPLAGMVAAALGLPVTALLADPGVTGARAVAETLDEPQRLEMGMRQDLHADLIRRILDHVIDQAIRVGRLQGGARIDPVTGHLSYALAGDQDRGIDIDFPDLSTTPLKELIEAIVAADGTELLPPRAIAYALLLALPGIEDVDAVMDELTDDEGAFLWPRERQGAAYDAGQPAQGQPDPQADDIAA